MVLENGISVRLALLLGIHGVYQLTHFTKLGARQLLGNHLLRMLYGTSEFKLVDHGTIVVVKVVWFGHQRHFASSSAEAGPSVLPFDQLTQLSAIPIHDEALVDTFALREEGRRWGLKAHGLRGNGWCLGATCKS